MADAVSGDVPSMALGFTEYWKKVALKHEYRHLLALVYHYRDGSTNSMPCERLFSLLNRINTNMRNSQKSETLTALAGAHLYVQKLVNEAESSEPKGVEGQHPKARELAVSELCTPPVDLDDEDIGELRDDGESDGENAQPAFEPDRVYGDSPSSMVWRALSNVRDLLDFESPKFLGRLRRRDNLPDRLPSSPPKFGAIEGGRAYEQ